MGNNKKQQLIKTLTDAGAEYVRSNRKGYDVYTLKGIEITVPHQPNEGSIAFALRAMQAALGTPAKNKRSPSKAKERDQKARERAKAEIERKKNEVRALLAMKEPELAAAADAKRVQGAQLDGMGLVLTTRETREIARRLERENASSRNIDRLMREVPLYGARD